MDGGDTGADHGAQDILTQQQIDAIFEQCALSREFFLREILDFTPDPWQSVLIGDLDNGETRISIRSGHGIGKTAACSVIALHFLLFRPGSTKIIITSPSSAQLYDGMWSELQLWMTKLPSFLRDQLEIKGKRIVDVNAPEFRFISLRTSRIENPEALQGVHADNVLLLIDEASGVPEAVYEAGAGTLSTVGSIAVLIGNPTRTTGYFYRTHNLLKDHWKTYRVASDESPRVSQAFIDDIIRTYGENSAQYKIRVLGEFADQDVDVIIPRTLAEPALGRDTFADGQTVWGLDPGRGGDPTGFVARTGYVITDVDQYHLTDLMQVVNIVHEKWKVADPMPDAIYVDSIGLGAGVADRLRELGLPIIDVNVAEAPALGMSYPKLRDELWFESRAWFETLKPSIPKTDYGKELVEELVSPLMEIDQKGRNKAESKLDMKRRGVASPNMADALNLTFAYGGAAASGQTKNSGWGKPLSRGLVGIA